MVVQCEQNLVKLDLSSNYIGVPIPEALGNLIFLEYLDVSGIFGGGIPTSLGSLSHLHILILGYNDLRKPISKIFENLPRGENTSLQILDLSYNHITGSVPDFHEYVSLRKLLLSNNKLKSLPSLSIQQLYKLEVLDVSYNSIEGTVHEAHLSQLHKLKSLDLSYNSLAINVNPNWVPPFQLGVVKLAGCTMGPSFPKWIHTQTNISQLDLSSAGIVDLVPRWMWYLSWRFEYFNLSHNQIHGRISDLASNFVGFPTIDISSNNFSGPLPLLHPNSSLLQLSDNMFQGPISSICKFKYDMLGLLDLSSNQLTGVIPNCWENMRWLHILNLANNGFSGEIPQNLCSSYLVTLNLRNNFFSGELPFCLRNCKYLKVMDIGENELVGNIPSWIGTHLTNLTVLSFRSNKFYGNIPPSICNNTDLQVLDMSRNNISGRTPKCFNNFTLMIQQKKTFESSLWLSLYSDEINTYIDKALVQWKGQESEYRKTLGLLKLIDLSSNKLSGSIPHEFCLLKGLVSLNLSRNDLTGKIDSDISQMEMLESLDLSRNQISGGIPVGLAQLTFLSVLDLSNNNLSGKISPGIQLDSFSASAYAGNSELCGSPMRLCPGDVYKGNETSDEGGDGFYISMVIGFIVGLWGVIATLLLNKSRRTRYS